MIFKITFFMLCQHCPPRSITWANHLNLSEQNFSPSLKALSQSRCKLFCGKSFCRTVVGRNRSIILGGASVERGCRRLRLVFLFAELSELFCCVGNLARAFLFYSAYHVFMCVCYSVCWGGGSLPVRGRSFPICFGLKSESEFDQRQQL